MDPLITTRLDIRRQVSVSSSIAASLAADRAAPLLPGTRARAEAVVAAGQRLLTFTELTPKQIYNATKAVIVGIAGLLENKERVLRRTMTPHHAAQQQGLGRVHALQAALFPQGTGFTRLPMDLQWGELVRLRRILAEPQVTTLIDAEGLSACADNLLGYIACYEHAVGHDNGGAGGGKADAQAAWTRAVQKLAAQVFLDYEDDPETYDELLGPYRRQVEEQRAAARAARAARSRKARGEAQEPQEAPAPLPEPGPRPSRMLEPQPEPQPELGKSRMCRPPGPRHREGPPQHAPGWTGSASGSAA